MGTIPTLPTRSAGAVATAAFFNDIKTVSEFWADPPKVSAYHSTLITLTTAAVTVVPLQSELFDVVQVGDSGMHDNVTLNSRLVARTAGKYQISGQIGYAANATNRRGAKVRLNAAGSDAGGTSIKFVSVAAANSGITTVVLPVFTYVLAVGDYIEMFATQDSGGNLNTVATVADTFLEARLIAA